MTKIVQHMELYEKKNWIDTSFFFFFGNSIVFDLKILLLISTLFIYLFLMFKAWAIKYLQC